MLTALHRVIAFVVLLPVVAYRKFISPLKRTPSCRFLPTCSEYAIEAVHERGVVVGGALAAWRVLRCNPLCNGGYDPVPSKSGQLHACKDHR
jgi:putative membrane protein insertion efficiency factor